MQQSNFVNATTLSMKVRQILVCSCSLYFKKRIGYSSNLTYVKCKNVFVAKTCNKTARCISVTRFLFPANPFERCVCPSDSILTMATQHGWCAPCTEHRAPYTTPVSHYCACLLLGIALEFLHLMFNGIKND